VSCEFDGRYRVIQPFSRSFVFLVHLCRLRWSVTPRGPALQKCVPKILFEEHFTNLLPKEPNRSVRFEICDT
jgi:hypothetical protein